MKHRYRLFLWNIKIVPHQSTGHSRQPQELVCSEQRRIKSCCCCSRQPAPSSPPEASVGPLRNNTQQLKQEGYTNFLQFSHLLKTDRDKSECSDPGWDRAGRRGKDWWQLLCKAERSHWEAAPLSSSPLGKMGLKQDYSTKFQSGSSIMTLLHFILRTPTLQLTFW